MRAGRRLLGLLFAMAAGAAVSAASLAGIAVAVGGTGASLAPVSTALADASAGGEGERAVRSEVARLAAQRRKLASRIARLRPQGTWILIDTGKNLIYLMNGESVVRQAICSTGTGRVLDDPETGRRWIFDTPRGEFEIQTKKRNPIWIKPDWAFVEEGKRPPKDFRERVEPDMLGDYAMDLGDGYLIHGTLYKRALGMSVTHGCVRVGDADLEAIFQAVGIGTRVYII